MGKMELNMSKQIKLGIPKGSLEKPTIEVI